MDFQTLPALPEDRIENDPLWSFYEEEERLQATLLFDAWARAESQRTERTRPEEAIKARLEVNQTEQRQLRQADEEMADALMASIREVQAEPPDGSLAAFLQSEESPEAVPLDGDHWHLADEAGPVRIYGLRIRGLTRSRYRDIRSLPEAWLVWQSSDGAPYGFSSKRDFRHSYSFESVRVLRIVHSAPRVQLAPDGPWVAVVPTAVVAGRGSVDLPAYDPNALLGSPPALGRAWAQALPASEAGQARFADLRTEAGILRDKQSAASREAFSSNDERHAINRRIEKYQKKLTAFRTGVFARVQKEARARFVAKAELHKRATLLDVLSDSRFLGVKLEDLDIRLKSGGLVRDITFFAVEEDAEAEPGTTSGYGAETRQVSPERVLHPVGTLYEAQLLMVEGRLLAEEVDPAGYTLKVPEQGWSVHGGNPGVQIVAETLRAGKTKTSTLVRTPSQLLVSWKS